MSYLTQIHISVHNFKINWGILTKALRGLFFEECGDTFSDTKIAGGV